MTNPFDEMPDDSVCAYCNTRLPDVTPDDQESDSWPFNGYCDAECCLRHKIVCASWPDDGVHWSTRKECVRALEEILAEWNRAKAPAP